MKKLSVALAVYNEEKTLSTCLRPLALWVDEIVVVDGGSADKTVEIAKQFGAKVIETDNPPIFHLNKQKAVDACSGNWILQLDADEIVTDDLQREIRDIVSGKSEEIKNGYFIPRKNYFLGRWMRKGGLYPDFVIRLFRKGKGVFPSKSVHEQIVIDGPVGYLTHPLLHFPYETIGEYFRKANTYSALAAREFARDHVTVTPLTIVQYILIKPIYTLFNSLVRHKGIFDGPWGILFAFFSAVQHPMALFKYMKGNYGT